jgi:hypothetical protein
MEASFHICYENAIKEVKDGLLKYKDVPKKFGGSGDELPEKFS